MVQDGSCFEMKLAISDDMLKLGCYVEPSIDIGPAMTTKVLADNGQVLHRSTYRPLTPDELLHKVGSDA